MAEKTCSSKDLTYVKNGLTYVKNGLIVNISNEQRRANYLDNNINNPYDDSDDDSYDNSYDNSDDNIDSYDNSNNDNIDSDVDNIDSNDDLDNDNIDLDVDNIDSTFFKKIIKDFKAPNSILHVLLDKNIIDQNDSLSSLHEKLLLACKQNNITPII
jgi:hypothetical protein